MARNIVHDTKQAIFDRIVADPALASVLGEYQGQAAAFGFSPIPEASGFPAIVCTAPVAVEYVESKEPSYVEMEWELRVVMRRSPNGFGDPMLVDHPAELLREAFETSLKIPNHHVMIQTVAGPVEASDAVYEGRVIGLEITAT